MHEYNIQLITKVHYCHTYQCRSILFVKENKYHMQENIIVPKIVHH